MSDIALTEPWEVEQHDATWFNITDRFGSSVAEAVPNAETAHVMAAAPDLKAALLTAGCPGGGWNGMPKDILRATVADCIKHGVCGCNLGDAVKKAEGAELKAA